MGAETPPSEWLSQLRRQGEVLRLQGAASPLKSRWTSLLETAADGTHLVAALVWTRGAEARIELLAAGGISRIAPPGGKLMLDPPYIEGISSTLGHVLKAVHAPESETPLVVDYIAATAVSRGLRGTLQEIGSRSNESQEEGTVVEAFVEIDADDLPGRRIGADVTAKIHCGRKSLGYVLFGDVVEFVQRKVWW